MTFVWCVTAARIDSFIKKKVSNALREVRAFLGILFRLREPSVYKFIKQSILFLALVNIILGNITGTTKICKYLIILL